MNIERQLQVAVYLIVIAVAIVIFSALLTSAVQPVNETQRNLLVAQNRWESEIQIGWKAYGINTCTEYLAQRELPIDIECNTLARQIIPIVVIGGLMIVAAILASIVVAAVGTIIIAVVYVAALFFTRHFPDFRQS